MAVNLLEEERSVFAAIALNDDRSLGEVIRRLATQGLESFSPDAAGKIKHARREHRQQTLFKL